MRRCPCLLVCLSLLATAACTLDSVAGPQPVPAPSVQVKAPLSQADVLLRGPKEIRVSPGPEPLYVVDGVVQAQMPGHLMAADITHIRLIRGDPAVARFGSRAAPGAVIITTRAAPVKALNDTQ